MEPKAPLFTVIYDGATLIEIDHDGRPRIDMEGCRKARIASNLIDITSEPLRVELTRLNQIGTAALCNPYREALGKLEDVFHEIPREKRGGMRKMDVAQVLQSVVRVAARSVQ